mmetsp:Transcript_64932/g.154924  ORF Transcript_64932/g.154924 Transcript_64932/m.154924 type:complete len:200 (+) Transcript_64932:263-862(+)
MRTISTRVRSRTRWSVSADLSSPENSIAAAWGAFTSSTTAGAAASASFISSSPFTASSALGSWPAAPSAPATADSKLAESCCGCTSGSSPSEAAPPEGESVACPAPASGAAAGESTPSFIFVPGEGAVTLRETPERIWRTTGWIERRANVPGVEPFTSRPGFTHSTSPARLAKGMSCDGVMRMSGDIGSSSSAARENAS